MLDLDDFIVVGFWIECGQPLLIGVHSSDFKGGLNCTI